MPRLLASTSVLAVMLVGCGGPVASDTDPSSSDEERTNSGTGSTLPVLSSSEAEYVDNVPGWTLIQSDYDDISQTANGVFIKDADSTISVYAAVSTDYPLDALPPGLAVSGAEEVDGLTCGSSNAWELGCYAPLTDGYFRIVRSYETESAGVEITITELAAVGRLVYESFSADPGDAPSLANNACAPLSAEDATEVLTPVLAGGDLTVDEEYTYLDEAGGDRCSFLLPEGAFAGGVGSTTYEGSDGYFGGFQYTRHRYDAGYTSTNGVYDAECQTGGYSPSEVFSSAVSCMDLMNEASGSFTEASVLPQGDGGTVTDGQTSFTVAPEGDYWYEGGLGGVSGDASFNGVLIEFAARLAAD